MRASIAAVADRLLAVVVPKADVSAGCPPDPYTAYCYCKGYVVYTKRCSTNGACKTFCGTCTRTDISC